MYKMIIFDMDGTLLDTTESIAYCVNNVLREYGYKIYELNEIKKFVGNGAKKLLKRALDSQNAIYNENDFEKMYLLLEKEFHNNYNYKVKFYDGIELLLDELEKNKIKMAINTNKLQYAAENITNTILKKWKFTHVIGDDKFHDIKPSKYAVDKIAIDENIELDDVCFIGDSIVDYQTAKNANVLPIICDWGFGKKEDFDNLNVKIVSSVSEILDIVLNKK